MTCFFLCLCFFFVSVFVSASAFVFASVFAFDYAFLFTLSSRTQPRSLRMAVRDLLFAFALLFDLRLVIAAFVPIDLLPQICISHFGNLTPNYFSSQLFTIKLDTRFLIPYP